MAMNVDLSARGITVFYLNRGLSFLKCVTISYERSGYTHLYCDCPVQRLTFPMVRVESPASERCPSPLPTAAVGSRAVAADVQDCPETDGLNVVQDDTKHFQVALVISQNPVGHWVPV